MKPKKHLKRIQQELAYPLHCIEGLTRGHKHEGIIHDHIDTIKNAIDNIVGE